MDSELLGRRFMHWGILVSKINDSVIISIDYLQLVNYERPEIKNDFRPNSKI
jgi:hypothetical protein